VSEQTQATANLKKRRETGRSNKGGGRLEARKERRREVRMRDNIEFWRPIKISSMSPEQIT
jgi:hypothetical protein